MILEITLLQYLLSPSDTLLYSTLYSAECCCDDLFTIREHKCVTSYVNTSINTLESSLLFLLGSTCWKSSVFRVVNNSIILAKSDDIIFSYWFEWSYFLKEIQLTVHKERKEVWTISQCTHTAWVSCCWISLTSYLFNSAT